MQTRLNSVLLVDDDNITNFFHEILLKNASITNQIKVAETVNQALKFIKDNSEEQGKGPDLIFLDLNMPGLTGWDFIESYQTLKGKYQLNSIIIVLSASANVDDYQKASKIKEVAEFRSKPMTSDMLEEIMRRHFLQS